MIIRDKDTPATCVRGKGAICSIDRASLLYGYVTGIIHGNIVDEQGVYACALVIRCMQVPAHVLCYIWVYPITQEWFGRLAVGNLITP
jgi:hypothetical protein